MALAAEKVIVQTFPCRYACQYSLFSVTEYRLITYTSHILAILNETAMSFFKK